MSRPAPYFLGAKLWFDAGRPLIRGYPGLDKGDIPNRTPAATVSQIMELNEKNIRDCWSRVMSGNQELDEDEWGIRG